MDSEHHHTNSPEVFMCLCSAASGSAAPALLVAGNRERAGTELLGRASLSPTFC